LNDGVVLRVVQPAEDIASDTAGPFDALFHAHYPRLVAMLARLLGDRGQAEEIVADAFCKLAEQHGAADAPTRWLYRVAMNAGLDTLRSNARRKRREEAAQRPQTAAGALDILLADERRERVRRVLSKMKPRDAQLLLLRADGMPYRELAPTLEIQPGSVGSILARAEREFERRYRARYGEEI
jgi:RNA polymerase sigma-70 factor (ECF subfamily)